MRVYVYVCVCIKRTDCSAEMLEVARAVRASRADLITNIDICVCMCVSDHTDCSAEMLEVARAVRASRADFLTRTEASQQRASRASTSSAVSVMQCALASRTCAYAIVYACACV
jgi:hypothetical protein